MKILGRLARAITQSMTGGAAEERSGVPWFSDAWSSGVRLGGSADDALSTLSTVARAVSLRSELLASVPIAIYRRTPDGGRERVDDHPLAALLADQFNPRMTAFEAREFIIRSVDLSGNGYCHLERDGAGRVVAIWPKPAHVVSVEVLASDRLRYRVSGERQIVVALEGDGSILHVRGPSSDGRLGRSLLDIARGAVQLALAQAHAAEALMRNSLRPSILLRHPGKLSQPALENLRQSLAAINAGPGNTGKPLVLEEGMEADPVSIKPQEAELLGHRKLSDEDIARIFGIPPAVLGIGDRPTYGSAVEESRQLVTACLAPLAARLEAAFARDLLTEAERRAGYYVRHSLEDLTRGDFKSRIESYKLGVESGLFSINETRRRENLPPIDGGDQHWKPLNFTTLEAPAGAPSGDA